jgi:hypothetical protein
MSVFDAEIFASAALADASKCVGEDPEAKNELLQMQQDIEATLAALEVEKDSRRARALRDDLETFLPARKAAIMAADQRARPGWPKRQELDDALAFSIKVTLVTAKSFITAGGM